MIIIIMKSSVDRDNNYWYYVILRNAGFVAINARLASYLARIAARRLARRLALRS
jgi:hypothetical protein